jgi:anti-repressor protein
MTNALLNVSTATTMSSLEIAELTGKEHKHVIRDIRVMLKALVDGPNLDHVSEVFDNRGYTSHINLDKEHTLCLVSVYNVQMRMAIIKRWQELETKQAPAVSVPQTYAAALLEAGRLAMEIEEKNAQLALAAPKVIKSRSA